MAIKIEPGKVYKLLGGTFVKTVEEVHPGEWKVEKGFNENAGFFLREATDGEIQIYGLTVGHFEKR